MKLIFLDQTLNSLLGVEDAVAIVLMVSDCTALREESLTTMPLSLPCAVSAAKDNMGNAEPDIIHFNCIPPLSQVVHHTGLIHFIPHKAEECDVPIPRVGRILEVVDTIEKVPGSENFPAIQEPFQEACRSVAPENERPWHFVRVDVVKSRSMFAVREFPVDDKILSSSTNGGAGGWHLNCIDKCQ